MESSNKLPPSTIVFSQRESSTYSRNMDKFGSGPRDSSIQSAFRKVLIHDHRYANPEAENDLWCPVLGQYINKVLMKAAHIFPYRLGEDVMKAVFGETSVNEMFSLRNGFALLGN